MRRPGRRAPRHPARRLDDALLNVVWEQGDSMMQLGARGSLESSTGYLICSLVYEALALRRQLDVLGDGGHFAALTPDEFVAWRKATVEAAEDAAKVPGV